MSIRAVGWTAVTIVLFVALSGAISFGLGAALVVPAYVGGAVAAHVIWRRGTPTRSAFEQSSHCSILDERWGETDVDGAA